MWLVMLLIVTLFIPDPIAVHVGALKITPAFAVAMLLFPILLLQGRIRWAWPELVILAMFTSWFLSNAMSAPLGRAIESTGRSILIGVIPYMAGRYLAQDVRRMKKAFTLVVTLVAVFSVIAILESIARFNPHNILWGIPYWPHHEMRLGLTRAHGWTTHAIMFGLVCAIFIPIVAVSHIERLRAVGKRPLIKLFCLFIGCFLSLSTGAWGPAVVSLMLVAWDYKVKIRTAVRWPLTFAVAIGGYFILEFATGRPLLRILMMQLHLTSPEAWYYRWRLFERVFQVMPGHWWMGYGLDIPDQFVGFGRSIDNNFLLFLLFYGRIGLFLWIGVFACVLLYGGKAVWANRDTPFVRLTRAIMFSLIGISLTQLSVAIFSTPGYLYWILLGVAVGASQLCRKEALQLDQLERQQAYAGRRAPRDNRRPAPLKNAG